MTAPQQVAVTETRAKSAQAQVAQSLAGLVCPQRTYKPLHRNVRTVRRDEEAVARYYFTLAGVAL